MGQYKIVCNVCSSTWSVMLDGQKVHTAGTAAEAVMWVKEETKWAK